MKSQLMNMILNQLHTHHKKILVGSTFITSMAYATYYRPIPSHQLNNDDHSKNNENTKRDDCHDTIPRYYLSTSEIPSMMKFIHFPSLLSSFSSSSSSSWDDRQQNNNDIPLFLLLARYLSIGVTTLAIRLFMSTYGSHYIVPNDHYRHLLNLIFHRHDDDDDFSNCSTNMNKNDIHASDAKSNNENNNKKANHCDQSNNKRHPNRKRPLITLSNHRSLFDDPGVISCLLPLLPQQPSISSSSALSSPSSTTTTHNFSQSLQPKYNRWGICSEEYCFNDSLPNFIKGYIGAGQVLPISRGSGLHQPLFYDFATLISKGEWCHLFPEGGVWQLDGLGGRNNDTDSKHSNIQLNRNKNQNKHQIRGKLKWGIGKLIAHAPVRPHVVIFAHAGMENLLPQDPINKRTYLKRNLFDSNDQLKVRIEVGPELSFDDLIQEHERLHGKLWVYSHDDDDDDCDEKDNRLYYDRNDHDLSAHHSTDDKRIKILKKWESSTMEEKILYEKITWRIEQELEILTRKVVCDLREEKKKANKKTAEL